MRKKKNFEDSIRELEDIVRVLEKGDTSLDNALSSFEKGIALVKDCQTMLDNAQKKVLIISEGKDGELTEQNFISEEE